MLQPIIDFLQQHGTLLVVLGLSHILAETLRALWAKAKVMAGNTPTKVDDFLVHVLDAPITAAISLAESGDVNGAIAKLRAIQATVPKR
jgi:hypothetical protein